MGLFSTFRYFNYNVENIYYFLNILFFRPATFFFFFGYYSILDYIEKIDNRELSIIFKKLIRKFNNITDQITETRNKKINRSLYFYILK